MAFDQVPFEHLKKKVIKAIKLLGKKYGYVNKMDTLILAYINPTKHPKDVIALYPNIPAKRQAQLGFLLTTMRLLNGSNEDADIKEKIFNGAVLYVFVTISESYDKKNLKSYFSSKEGSSFYTNLGYGLGINDESSIPEPKEQKMFFEHLCNFIARHVYSNPEECTYLDSEQTPFLDHSIAYFSVEKWIKDLNNRIAVLKNGVVDHARAARSLSPVCIHGIFGNSSPDSSRNTSPAVTSSDDESCEDMEGKIEVERDDLDFVEVFKRINMN